MTRFVVESPYQPTGHQPQAIAALARGLEEGKTHQVLLGVTGSGKTFTMAKVIEQVQRPTLVLAHNKTLAAQLYSEFKALFPGNAVEYFVSYYDYYQPEAYIPSTDTFIDKDASVNDDIDRLRLSATRALFERRDVIIVASVSCIYGLGGSENYYQQAVKVMAGQEMDRDGLLKRLVKLQYQRNEADFHRGVFRVRGDVVDVFPSEWEKEAVRITFFGDTVEAVEVIDPLKGQVTRTLADITVFPATHYVTPQGQLERAIGDIMEEMRLRVAFFEENRQYLEAQRLGERTRYDMELLATMGFCNGIENYSRHLDGRKPGQPPSCLLNYFPRDWLLFVDESHVTLPQVGGMYRGDRSRKDTLVQYGFRLPSAVDNRPLNFEEFSALINQAVYVSATPGDYEMGLSDHEAVEQIIRPTGLLDPRIEVRPALNQVDDLLEEIRQVTARSQRVLVTTLTKRMAEELTDYYDELGVKVRYLHSDIDTLERMDILRDLRKGLFDVLVGINLLREGLDLPEVSLVAILDADKEGFLRSGRSLIQTVGRAARNAQGRVIMYAQQVTGAMDQCLRETARRREIQDAYNRAHGITPQTIIKQISDFRIYGEQDYLFPPKVGHQDDGDGRNLEPAALKEHIRLLEKRMFEAAAALEFETAALLRDQVKELQTELGEKLGGPVSSSPRAPAPRRRPRGGR